MPSIMVFTPDGRSLIVTLDRAPRIWHLDPDPEPPPPQGHKDEAWSVAFAADGKALATGSDDTDDPQTVKLWDPSSGRLIRGWHGGDGTVAALAFSPDGLTLASGHSREAITYGCGRPRADASSVRSRGIPARYGL